MEIEAIASMLMLVIAVLVTGVYIGNYSSNYVIVPNAIASGGNNNLAIAGNTTGNNLPNNLSPGIALSLQEIAKHSALGSCWIVVNNRVYDVTTYLAQHPAGAGQILPYCGAADATAAFATRGGTGTHSAYADQLLAAYFIGDVGGQATSAQINSLANNTVALPAPKLGDEYFDD